jgi:pilus assembly protein CpaE
MLPHDRIQLLTADSAAARACAEALERAQAVAEVRACRTLEELERTLDSDPAPLALVDVDPDPPGMLATIERLASRFPRTRFVALCSERRDGLVLEAMQAGARGCLLKSAVREELPGVFQRLVQDGANGRAAGEMVSVLSAGGGSGATTVAFNLAEELRLASRGRALLVDMDHCYGALATHLGVQGQYGLADVLAHQGTIDAQLISSTATVFRPDLHVLVSSASIDFSEPATLRYESLGRALDACQRAYDYTVVDAPRATREIAVTLARASARTLIVFQLDVVDVRIARAMASSLLQRGVSSERLLLVANRHHKRRSMLSLADAREALDGLPLQPLTNDFAGATRSLNFGKPLAEVAPRSPLRKGLRAIAEAIAVRGEPAGAAGGKR